MTVDSQGAAMHAVAEMCKAISALPEGVVFNTKLIACELLSNAMKYGGGSAEFRYTVTGRSVRLAVRCAIPFDPPVSNRMPDPAAESGRGLFLVDALSETREYNEEEGIVVTVGE